jgi:hypothetical protein
MINRCYICAKPLYFGKMEGYAPCCAKCSAHLFRLNGEGSRNVGGTHFALNHRCNWEAHIETLRRNPPCLQCGEIHP